MFSRRRHRALVDGLVRSQEPVAAAGSFALYWLNQPGPADREDAAELVAVHDLVLDDIDNNVGKQIRYVLLPMLGRVREELGAEIPLWGSWAREPHELFGDLIAAAVFSVHADPVVCARWFYRNTLRRLQEVPGEIDPTDFIQPFGAIYRRVLALRQGSSLLDVGTCYGFLPMLVAIRQPDAAPVLGVDREPYLVDAARRYSAHAGLTGVEFTEADLFGPGVSALPRFDTVTAIHVLEHLPPKQIGQALEILWERTDKRLIVNVPIEETPDPYFGHRHCFTVDQLAELAERLAGRGMVFEEHGAWLVLDRAEPRPGGTGEESACPDYSTLAGTLGWRRIGTP